MILNWLELGLLETEIRRELYIEENPFFFFAHVCSSKQANWHVVILTFTSGLANFLALEVITMNDWYTSSSLNLSWKQPKFSCNFRMPFSLYGSTDKQKATSFHCRSVLSGKERVQFIDLGHVLLDLFWNRNSWNDQNNSSFSGLSWLQTCQNQLAVSLWRFYSLESE